MREGISDNYDDDMPEALLVLDTDGNIHIMRGKTYGKTFS